MNLHIAKKLLCDILILFYFILLPFDAVCAEEVTDILVFFDQCEKLQQVHPSPNAAKYLKKRDIVLSDKIKLPCKWLINWWSMSSQTLVGGEKAFRVSAPLDKPVEIFAHCDLPNSSRYYTIELTVRMPLQSRYAISNIGIGIFRYGYYAPAQKILAQEKLRPGETKTIKTKVDISDDFCLFRPSLSITGDVEIKNITLWKNIDDLSKSGRTVIEGTLIECSQIPDPAKSDYPNCRFICKFNGNSIIAGKPCPREIAIVLEGFENYKYKNTRNLKAGDMVRMLIVPFDELPEVKKTTQQADDLHLYMLDSYYVEGISKITDFADGNIAAASGVSFLSSREEYVSIFDLNLNPPMSDELQKIRNTAVKKELHYINQLLEPYDTEKIAQLNKDFKLAWKQEAQKDAPGKNRIAQTVWRNIDNSFWTLPLFYRIAPPVQKIEQHNLDALVSFKDFLKANGTHFIVVPIPHFYDISARVINKEFKDVPDFRTAYIVKQLLENDIEAIYISEKIIKNFNRYPFAFFFPDNPHPSDTTQDILSDELAVRIKRYNLHNNLDPLKFSVTSAPHVYFANKHFFFPADCDIGTNKPNTPYQCRRVLYENKDIYPDKNSEVLLFGNSFIQTPMSYPDSLTTLLMQKICMKIASYRIASSGPVTQIIPAIFTYPSVYVAGKKVVIMVVGRGVLTQNINMPDVRSMDNNAMILTGKSCVYKYDVKKSLKITENNHKSKLLDLDAVKWDPAKDAAVVIPVLHTSLKYKAYFFINGRKLEIPSSGSKVPHVVVSKLPKGTRNLLIELTAHPDAIPTVSNIQIYQ